MAITGFEATGNEVVKAFRSRVDGRTFVITGAGETGLGAETALSLCANGSPRLLILVGRRVSVIQPVVDRIAKEQPTIPVRIVELDLSSLDSVRAGASKINQIIDEEGGGRLDVLINNAAVMVPPYGETTEGLEQQFGINHIGHFLLTKSLFKRIESASGGEFKPRVVNVSSGAHRMSGIRFDDLNFQNGTVYEPWIAYGQSKTANILFTSSLAKRAAAKNVLSFSVHPGSIKSPLQRHMNKKVLDDLNKLIGRAGPPNYKTLQQGCSTTLTAALSPVIEDKAGAYLEDAQLAQPGDKATSASDADKLWDLSEKLIGEKFEI